MTNSVARRAALPGVAWVASTVLVMLSVYGFVYMFKWLLTIPWSLENGEVWRVFGVGVIFGLGCGAALGAGAGGVIHTLYWGWVTFHGLIRPTCEADVWNHPNVNGEYPCPFVEDNLWSKLPPR